MVLARIDDKGGYLIRPDGVVATCLQDKNNCVPVIDFLAKEDHRIARIETCGFQEIELGPRTSTSATLLLMGHYRDGYVSAVVTLDEHGLLYEGVMTGQPAPFRQVAQVVVGEKGWDECKFEPVDLPDSTSKVLLAAMREKDSFSVITESPVGLAETQCHFCFRLKRPMPRQAQTKPAGV